LTQLFPDSFLVKFPTGLEEEPQDGGPSWFIENLCHCPRNNVEQSLILRDRNLEIRKRYMAALKKLGPVQRAAWILGKDELLTLKEAAPLLPSTLHWRTARVALGARPMKAGEASRLLDRADVSPDVSKAGSRLAEQLADMNPAMAWDTPPQKWSREFLIGSTRSGSTLAIRPWICSTREDSMISDRDRDSIRQLPPRYRSRPPSDPNQECEYDLL
jgi:hypothetical protein